VAVNIDKEALDWGTVKIDYPIICDAKTFLSELPQHIKGIGSRTSKSWRSKCAQYKAYNDTPRQWSRQADFVNPYVFMDVLSEATEEGEVVVVDGGGTNLYTSFQGYKPKARQRLTLSSGICAMGTGLPEAVGACFACGRKRTICTTGDGSLQLNIQELQTVVHHQLPVKIFVMSNEGYLAIRHTQDGFLQSRYVGSSSRGGVSLPDFIEVATAYRLKTARVRNHTELHEAMSWIMSDPGPVLCELMVSPQQKLICSQGFKENADGTFSARPLEDMEPLLDREEFLQNMVTRPLELCTES
jgi:acetolactate synthase-1/2/3 large subunit